VLSECRARGRGEGDEGWVPVLGVVWCDGVCGGLLTGGTSGVGRPHRARHGLVVLLLLQLLLEQLLLLLRSGGRNLGDRGSLFGGGCAFISGGELLLELLHLL